MTRTRPATAAAVLIVAISLTLLLGGAVEAVDPESSIHERVSVSSDEAQANGASYSYTSACAVSADGRYVAFQSDASDLVAGDTNGTTDVFVRDRATGTTERVSVATGGAQANGASTTPAISGDGRYVGFSSGATNLVDGDTNGWVDVFVHDRQTGTTERVSISSDEGQGTNPPGDISYYTPCVSLSSDGRYVAFNSSFENLVADDTNTRTDIFVRDRQEDTTERVSVSNEEAQADGSSGSASLNADGRYVVFASSANNLVAGDTKSNWDIFVRDRQEDTTERVSVSSTGAEANDLCSFPAISGDGRIVAFDSYAGTLVPNDTNWLIDTFVHDRQTGITERASVSASGAQVWSESAHASLSYDGRLVAFESYASGLVPGDTNGTWDVFVRDRLIGSTQRVSTSVTGVQGDGASDKPAFSADGHTVAFYSVATNLVTGDTNGLADVFAVHLRSYRSIRGVDRFDTALKISKAMFPAAEFPDGLPADSGIVLAPGWESYQEALCGAPLAAAWGGPVLLSSKTVLYSGVAAELVRLDPDQVFCIGLTPALAAAVQVVLPGATVTPINGDLDDFYDMSYRVAEKLGERVDAIGGDISAATAIVTVGYNFPDAIGVGPLACSNLWPVILTDQPDDKPLHDDARDTLTDLGITQALKVGTYATLPGGVTGVANLSGANRYYTNANVAEWGYENGGLEFTHTGLATGDKFPDALASGPYLTADAGVLLLTPLNGPLPAVISNLMAAHRADVESFSYIAMIEPVIGQVKVLLP